MRSERAVFGMGIFKLVGLEKINGGRDIVATCEPVDKEETFKAQIDMPIDRKFALWELLKGNWGGATCRIEFTTAIKNVPQDAVLKEIHLPTTNQ